MAGRLRGKVTLVTGAGRGISTGDRFSMPRNGMTMESATTRWRDAIPGWLAALALLLAAVPARAQYATACPPPKKFAAGACVTACPGGYEDRGRECVYRNQSR